MVPFVLNAVPLWSSANLKKDQLQNRLENEYGVGKAVDTAIIIVPVA
jgi:hypothetical protein